MHRDIKPDNILIDRESGRAMVTDFGIARAAEGDAKLTVTGVAIGTPAYMSPEQALGEKESDGRSDIYSLGVVGYLMLTGELPFKASNTPSMMMKHLTEPLRPVREVRPDAPSDLAAVVEHALAKKPEDRFSNASDMASALAHPGWRAPSAAAQNAGSAAAARAGAAARGVTALCAAAVCARPAVCTTAVRAAPARAAARCAACCRSRSTIRWRRGRIARRSRSAQTACPRIRCRGASGRSGAATIAIR